MLLRYYSRPPNINENFSGIVISMLPWALILHLAFSVWMYGDSGCLASAPVNLSNAYVTEKYNHYIAIFAQHDRFGLAPKLGRLIVFPNAALLALLVLLRVLWSVLIQPFWSIIAKYGLVLSRAPSPLFQYCVLLQADPVICVLLLSVRPPHGAGKAVSSSLHL